LEKTAEYNQVVVALKALSISPDYRESVEDLLVQYKKWRSGDLEKHSSVFAQNKTEISEKIDSLIDKLTAKKDSVSFPIDFEKKFSGTLHCESCLASILHKGTRDTMVAVEYKDLLKQTEVDYHISDLSML
jgi:hypothetical protein